MGKLLFDFIAAVYRMPFRIERMEEALGTAAKKVDDTQGRLIRVEQRLEDCPVCSGRILIGGPS
jgi:hypothetical protein